MSEITLSTGRRLYANNQILGLSLLAGDDRLYEGYDGTAWDPRDTGEWSDTPPLTETERREVADLMIQRWRTWADKVAAPSDTEGR
jgi:hypothetical protein